MSKRRQRSRSEVRGILEELRSSGLSRNAFADSRDISASTINFWVRREKELVRKVGGEAARQSVVPVRIIPSLAASGDYSLWLPNGIRVSVPRDFDASSLARLVEVVAR
jgi:hypothetical protein